ncbi:UNVERIFIED_CONTAM: hypothetical protein FKN15_028587 [Acipenser sinensis]
MTASLESCARREVVEDCVAVCAETDIPLQTMEKLRPFLMKHCQQGQYPVAARDLLPWREESEDFKPVPPELGPVRMRECSVVLERICVREQGAGEEGSPNSMQGGVKEDESSDSECSPAAEGEYLLVPSPPPPAEGEYLLVPHPPSWEGLLLPCLAPPKDAWFSASPKDACCSTSPGESPVTGYEGEVELLLPPPWPGAPLPSSPPEGPLLLPSPPEIPVLPGVATSPAMRQEILWLEPHEGELLAMKKGGEVRRPAPPAVLSRQEIQWLEPHEGQLSAMKKGGEVRRPAPPAAISL